MPLKFRLKGLAETLIETLRCPQCGHEGGDDGDKGFQTDLSRVTYDGIIVVCKCLICNNVFVPDNQKHGIINSRRLRSAVDKDSKNTGQPVYVNSEAVRLEVERMRASKDDKLQ
ncbi:MAG: hypothetical protein IT292_11775 [Deltaproteobacteria bacterium]|nr:hypothetical protein [Deltaproteobacteria bacterium]